MVSYCARGVAYHNVDVQMDISAQVETAYAPLAHTRSSRIIPGVLKHSGDHVVLKQPVLRTQADLDRFHSYVLNFLLLAFSFQNPRIPNHHLALKSLFSLLLHLA